jgi:hypothetical protein
LFSQIYPDYQDDCALQPQYGKVAAEKFNVGETDYTSILTMLKAAEPEVLYPAAFSNEQSLIVTPGRRDVGLNITYLSVENTDEPSYSTGVGSWGDYSIQESRFSPYAIPPGADPYGSG